MATPTSPGSSLSSQSPSSTASDSIGPSNLPPVSLSIYVFSAVFALFMTIVGVVLVARSVRRRRLRNAPLVAALASGASESKPVLWETLITAGSDGEKGWSGLLPVGGVISVPATEAVSQHTASKQPRLRFPPLGILRRSVAPDLRLSVPSIESPASSSRPIYLTVIVSMPTPRAYGKAIQDSRGPPVIEFGVTQVTYKPVVP